MRQDIQHLNTMIVAISNSEAVLRVNTHPVWIVEIALIFTFLAESTEELFFLAIPLVCNNVVVVPIRDEEGSVLVNAYS